MQFDGVLRMPYHVKNILSVTNFGRFVTVAYPGILFGGGVVQQIQLRTEDRENGDLWLVAP